MITYVKILKKSYPVNFGTWFARQFEADTGVNLSESSFSGSQTDNLLNIIWHALQDGARVKGEAWEIAKPDLADLLDKDSETFKDKTKTAMYRIANLYLKSQGIPQLGTDENGEETEEADDEESKKKEKV